MKIVKLKNGSEEAMVLVTATMLALQSLLLQTDAIAFCELVMKCRGSAHELFGNTQEVLKKLSLVDQNGEVHDSTRNIVLSAAVGEGLNLSLQSPIAE
jgi:hypothetical protein